MIDEPSRKLRGAKLEVAAIEELKIWPRNKALTWSALAELFAVTRQALMTKLEIRREFERCKLTLSAATKASRKRDQALGSAEEEVAYLRAENDRLRITLEQAQLRFACVEHNAMMKGVQAEEFWAPIERER